MASSSMHGLFQILCALVEHQNLPYPNNEVANIVVVLLRQSRFLDP